jgi:indole-3-glycerol phosphate synthase
MNVLTEIISKKTERLKYAKSSIPLRELKKRIYDSKKTRDFKSAVKRTDENIRLIAEIKRASPSKGIIRKDFDPVRIAAIYEEKPVNAISVLTEEDFFQGHLSFILKVRDVTSKPVLRKDFIFDEYQIYESRASGADAILLIASILEKNQSAEYLHICSELGLSVLFEVHDEHELEKALGVNADIIGINNRDLKTLKIDLATTLRLKKMIPEGRIIISESGINNRSNIVTLQQNGIDAILIGTSFMEADDIAKKIDELIKT